MKKENVFEGLTGIEKKQLIVDPFFALPWKLFDFLGPKTHDANSTIA